MEERIAKLMDLQNLDRKLDRTRADLDSIPGEMMIHRKEMDAHENSLTQFETALESCRKSQSSLKSEQQDFRTRVSEYRTKLLSIRTNDEYRAMLKQIDYALGRIDDMDTGLLELMEEEENLEGRLEKARRDLERYRSRYESRCEMLSGRRHQLESQLDRLTREREAAASRVDLKLLRKYEQARNSGRQEIVVGLKSGACGGCLTNVPPQNGVEIRGGCTFDCPMCGCFVVWTDDSSLSGER